MTGRVEELWWSRTGVGCMGSYVEDHNRHLLSSTITYDPRVRGYRMWVSDWVLNDREPRDPTNVEEHLSPERVWVSYEAAKAAFEAELARVLDEAPDPVPEG